MESGLEGRNNLDEIYYTAVEGLCLNGVRPRRPEQFGTIREGLEAVLMVSMESGLEGRNNSAAHSMRSWPI